MREEISPIISPRRARLILYPWKSLNSGLIVGPARVPGSVYNPYSLANLINLSDSFLVSPQERTETATVSVHTDQKGQYRCFDRAAERRASKWRKKSGEKEKKRKSLMPGLWKTICTMVWKWVCGVPAWLIEQVWLEAFTPNACSYT